MDIDKRLQEAVQSFWTGRDAQSSRQQEAGKVDAGIREAVTGGQHMGALETLVVDVLISAGLTLYEQITRFLSIGPPEV